MNEHRFDRHSRKDCPILLDAPSESLFIQLDLGESHAFETVAMVPEVMNFQLLTHWSQSPRSQLHHA